ncbi:hypothetical protein BS630_10895 [Rhizobium laguerreae]|nr:hypothetical protein BS630_10895 [Rhizobium laguerreae]
MLMRHLWSVGRGSFVGSLERAAAPHPAAATFSPQAGRRAYAALSRFLSRLSQGTSPLPVFTGRGLG